TRDDDVFVFQSLGFYHSLSVYFKMVGEMVSSEYVAQWLGLFLAESIQSTRPKPCPAEDSQTYLCLQFCIWPLH
ncbi:MAG TPA: hypothetical protein VM260_21890, partial [Pirellula sp.]|nr:hypothetical protein [Pirellula sp.]